MSNPDNPVDPRRSWVICGNRYESRTIRIICMIRVIYAICVIYVIHEIRGTPRCSVAIRGTLRNPLTLRHPLQSTVLRVLCGTSRYSMVLCGTLCIPHDPQPSSHSAALFGAPRCFTHSVVLHGIRGALRYSAFSVALHSTPWHSAAPRSAPWHSTYSTYSAVLHIILLLRVIRGAPRYSPVLLDAPGRFANPGPPSNPRHSAACPHPPSLKCYMNFEILIISEK